MLDHIFLTVTDTDRSIAFYEKVLPVLGITARGDYDGKDGPPGHPDLKGFGAKGRMFFWLRQGDAAPAGVRDYIERFFVGYRTVTRLLSFTSTGERQTRLRVDFTGDFGHEIGLLEILTDPAGLIVRIYADLE